MDKFLEKHSWAAGIAGTTLIMLAIWAPQLASANNRLGDLIQDQETIVHKCIFQKDGSAVCPPGTFYIDKVKVVHK